MPPSRFVSRLVSGGQTGVDRAALDVAQELGLAHGGWCRAGGAAEDLPDPPGVLALYPGLRETESADPAVRTERNVRDSDATLVLVPGEQWHSPGTTYTVECCQRLHRPHLVAVVTTYDEVSRWLADLPTGVVLNVAGPRESQSPGIYDAARACLRALLSG